MIAKEEDCGNWVVGIVGDDKSTMFGLGHKSIYGYWTGFSTHIGKARQSEPKCRVFAWQHARHARLRCEGGGNSFVAEEYSQSTALRIEHKSEQSRQTGVVML